MARKPRWKYDGWDEGIVTYTISSWKYFHDFIINQKLMDFKTYVYRGQRNEKWLLEPSINRKIKNSVPAPEYKKLLQNQLDFFKFSVRGRTPYLKEILNDEKELWALGQHHGLNTPLLDFTFSPYVAIYFAFIDEKKLTDYRIIWAVSQHTTTSQVGKELELFKPLSGHNLRLINQNGLFIKFNVNKDLETIFRKSKISFDGEIQLYKIRIPNKDRILCLRFLNRMNINHNTLFPDVYGASIYSNTDFDIKNY